MGYIHIYIYIYNGILFSHKNNEISRALCYVKSDKDKYRMISLICGIYKQKTSSGKLKSYM